MPQQRNGKKRPKVNDKVLLNLLRIRLGQAIRWMGSVDGIDRRLQERGVKLPMRMPALPLDQMRQAKEDLTKWIYGKEWWGAL